MPGSSLTTPRLLLRPFRPDDALAVATLAGDPAVAATAVDLPHPLGIDGAEAWIASHATGAVRGTRAVWALERRDTGGLAGAVGLTIEPAHRRAELGYWLGQPHWGLGFAVEGTAAALAHGFGSLGLARVIATHLVRNARSGRVLQRLGFVREGVLRQHVEHRGVREDLVVAGLTAEDWRRRAANVASRAA